jgi:serine/threonine-protein kinase
LELQPGLVVADRFRLVRPLGQGGMGAVWLAQHTGLDIPCAVKFIHEEAARSHELRVRFEREAKAAAQLRSPHVVQILDHGVWQDTPYIAMELLEGEDLARRLRKRRPLEPREVAAIASQVGRALVKAHAAGLVHRDLKPANIFLVHDDDREIAKVLDFGVAKATALGNSMGTEGDTKTGAIVGTPSFMSPEQARGNKDVDHLADLWALAVVVFLCLTGKLPFRSDALGDLLVKIIVEPLPVPSEIASVPPGFDAWWARAANRDPTLRFQTAKELTEALALALEMTSPPLSDVGSSAAIPVPRGPFPSVAADRAPASEATLDAPAPITLDPQALQTAVATVMTPSPSSATRASQADPTLPTGEAPSPRRGRAGVVAFGAAALGLLALVAVISLRGGAPAPAETRPSGAPPPSAAPTGAGVASAAPSALPPSAPAAPSAAATLTPTADPSATPPRPAAPRAAPAGKAPTPRPGAPGAPAVKPRTDFGI